MMCMAFIAIVLFAQDKIYEDNISNFDGIWSRFDDDYNALDKWIASNVKYPQEALNNNEQGVVEVSVVVEKDGSLSQVKVQKSVSPSLDTEAIRLATIMPKWKCAYNYGVPCRSRNKYSVKFNLPKKMANMSSTTTISSRPNSLTYSEIDWTNSSGQKIYEGEFELAGIKGRAKYQYKEAASGTPIYNGYLVGTRMFDGHFVFDGQGLHAEGDFRQNRQVGTWHWSNKNGEETAVVYFNDNGELAGNFTFNWDGLKAEGTITKGRKPWLSSYTNYISNIKTTDNNIEAEGGFNYEDKGAGKWKVRETKGSILKRCNSNYNYEWTYAIYDKDGHLESWYFIDDSTGDKRNMGRAVNDLLYNINHNVWLTLNMFAFRQTLTLHQ